jgi:hypothetical protein
MPPKAQKGAQQATTPDQMKFVMTWLDNVDNRLSCFGGAGAKSSYGGKSVVKPSTAYNALAQAVNKKFGCSWDGESAKSRIRTMKTKFHAVFTLSNGGHVQEETASWKLTDADKAAGILTLLDKAQHQCPYWNSWMEWCGNDPNLSKHGSGGSGIQLNVDSSDGEEPRGEVGDHSDSDAADAALHSDAADAAHHSNGEEDAAKTPASFAQLAAECNSKGDHGNVGEGDDGSQVPRAVSAKVDAAASGSDPLKAQMQKRKAMLASLSAEQKRELYATEAKAKRAKEQAESDDRRSKIADAAPTPQSPRDSTSGSPFGKSPSMSKDWQAAFLVDHKKDEMLRAERMETSQLAVAKLQLAAAERRDQAELEHKQNVLLFQQQQAQMQQQQA